MARTPRNQAACDELTAALVKQYAKLPTPKPSWPSIAREIAVRFGISMSDETVKKMHEGMVDPNTASADFLLGVARYYDCKMSDLGPIAERRLDNLLVLAQKSKKMNHRPRPLGAQAA